MGKNETMDDSIVEIKKLAKKVIDSLNYADINTVVVWGSVPNLHNCKRQRSDIDLLIIKDRLIDLSDYEIMYGIPTKVVSISDYKMDLFFADIDYVKQSINQNHWTMINAIQNGIIIKDNGLLKELRELCCDFRALSLTTPHEWLNQAKTLYKKSQDVLETGDHLQSIILSRHAADAMLYALIYRVVGKPPSPKSFLTDLKDKIHHKEIYDMYLEIQDLNSKSRIEAMQYNLLCLELIQKINNKI